MDKNVSDLDLGHSCLHDIIFFVFLRSAVMESSLLEAELTAQQVKISLY